MDALLTVFLIVGFVLLMALITMVLYSRISHLSTEDSGAEKSSEPAELHEDSFGKDEIADLVKSFNSMEGALTRQMHDIAHMTAERERTRAELDVAAKMQYDMLPKNFPKRDDFEIFAMNTPAREMSGDFYDFFMIDEDHVGLVMADVAGKGVPAAMFMIVTKTLMKIRTTAPGTPSQMLYEVNNTLCADNPSGLFVTVWFGILTISSGELICTNSGHEYPAIMRKGGRYELLEGENYPPVGTVEDIEFGDVTVSLQPGDRIFLYTDGVPEAKNAAGERFGTDKMLEILDRDRELSTEQQLKNLQSEIEEFTGTGEPFDDVTMMGFVWNGRKA